MATMEKKIKYCDEEVSEKVVAKIRQEAERDLKKELFRQVVRKDYKCANYACQGLPRPGDNNFTKCLSCSLVSCAKCNFVKPYNCCRNKSRATLPFSLLQFLPFQCQNTKYGCQEILMTEELVDHEKYCDYQKVHCAKIDCKTDISFLNLLGEFFQLAYFLYHLLNKAKCR